MTECQKRGKHQYSNFNSHGIANDNILFLKDNERFHKSEGKQKPKIQRRSKMLSRAFTSSSLAVFPNFAPGPLCKEMFIEHGNGSENKHLWDQKAKNEGLGQG